MGSQLSLVISCPGLYLLLTGSEGLVFPGFGISFHMFHQFVSFRPAGVLFS